MATIECFKCLKQFNIPDSTMKESHKCTECGSACFPIKDYVQADRMERTNDFMLILKILGWVLICLGLLITLSSGSNTLLLCLGFLMIIFSFFVFWARLVLYWLMVIAKK